MTLKRLYRKESDVLAVVSRSLLSRHGQAVSRAQPARILSIVITAHARHFPVEFCFGIYIQIDKLRAPIVAYFIALDHCLDAVSRELADQLLINIFSNVLSRAHVCYEVLRVNRIDRYRWRTRL